VTCGKKNELSWMGLVLNIFWKDLNIFNPLEVEKVKFSCFHTFLSAFLTTFLTSFLT